MRDCCFWLHHSQKILVHGCSWVHAFDVIFPMLSMQLRNFFRTPKSRVPSQESLQQLRAKNDLGHSTCGRQRREKPGEKRRRQKGL